MLPNNFVCAGYKYNTFEENVPAPVFRKDFDVEKIPRESFLVIGATGFYELYLNGENITDGYLSPYISNSNYIVFYRKYDIASKLKCGKNTIAVILGNGYANPLSGKIWGHTERKGRGTPAFTLLCDFFTESDMRWNYSHILFDDERCGTFCDRRLENPNIYFPGYDDSLWNVPNKAEAVQGEKHLVTAEPVRGEKNLLKAKNIRTGAVLDYRIRDAFKDKLPQESVLMTPPPPCGGYIYDFGENNAVIPILKIKGKTGQKIHMQFSELLFEGFVYYGNTDVYPDGCCQQDIYICRGDAEGEVYIPPFTYHGARYCYVYGITEEQATDELLNLMIIHNDMECRSTFSCDGKFVNEIYDACIRSDKSNAVQIFTDCPSREKNGWTGDIGISAEQYMTAFGAENCFADFLKLMRTSQTENGGIPLILPAAEKCDGESPVWDCAMVYMPYYAYVYTGRTDIIEENAEAMIKTIRNSMSKTDERGIIECGMGDWLPVDCEADEYSSPLGFCVTAVTAEMSRMCRVMFLKINREDYAQECECIRRKLISAIREEYIKGATVCEGKKNIKREYRSCLTSQALAICLNVFKEEEKEEAYKVLVKLAQENEYSFDCGFLGLRYIFHALTEAGRSDIAYKMITKPSHPSYANMIIRGETTLWERFCMPGKRIGSHNHHFFGDVSSWLVKVIGGIRVNPRLDDPNTVLVNPEFLEGINEAKAYTKTPNGELYVSWKRVGKEVRLFVTSVGGVKVLLSDKAKQAMNK